MKYLDFEKHIKNEFENSKEPVQMDSLLASLDLGKEPKRKGFVFWMIVPFLILIFSVLAWKFTDSKNINVEELSQLDGVSSEANSLASTTLDKGSLSDMSPEVGSIVGNSTESGSVSEISLEAESTTENSKKSNTSRSSSVETNALYENAGKEKNSNQKDKKLGGAASYTESSFSVQGEGFNIIKTQINNSKNNNSEESDTREKRDENIETTTKTFNKRPPANKDQANYKPQNSYPIQSGQFNNESGPNTTINQSTESETSVNSDFVGNSSNAIAAKKSRALLSIDGLDQSIDVLDDREVDGKLFSRMKINCPSFEDPSWHMALIPEIGVFLPRKTLTHNDFEESAAFLERLKSETTLEGIQVGLYGMLVRDNIPFYLKAGLSYSRITERMDLEYEYTQKDTTLGIISTTVSGNGDTITHIYGDIVSETTFKGSNRQHHYIHLFDVPVSVGYTTYIGGLDVGIEAGFRVNFMTRATGNLLTSQTEYTNLSLNRLFKNRIGVSYFGGLMLGRNFGRFGDIYIAPRFTYFPDDFNNQNNRISQKYFTIGLNAGVVYMIN